MPYVHSLYKECKKIVDWASQFHVTCVDVWDWLVVPPGARHDSFVARTECQVVRLVSSDVTCGVEVLFCVRCLLYCWIVSEIIFHIN